MRRAIQSAVSRRPLQPPTRPLLITIVLTTTGPHSWRYYAESRTNKAGSSSSRAGGVTSSSSGGTAKKVSGSSNGSGGGGGGGGVKKHPPKLNPPPPGFEELNKRSVNASRGNGKVAVVVDIPALGNGEEKAPRQLTGAELPPGQWKHINDSTAHFSQLAEESSVWLPESLTKNLLVDNPAYTTNIKLWQILLKFRRRLYEHTGVREIWDGLRLRKLDLPATGASADELWGVFLRSAAKDDKFMEAMWAYIQDLEKRTGKVWSGVYDTIIGTYFIDNPMRARAWHYRLYPRHVSRSLPKLFAEVLTRTPDAHMHLRVVHAVTRKPAGVYGTMIRSLCELGLHAEAVRWHNHCLSYDDLPADTGVANPLVVWMAKYGTINELRQLVYSFVEMGVKMAESTLVGIIISRPGKIEALRFILARSNEFSTDAMGDRFWAHVIAQQGIDKEDLYRYLCTFAAGLSVGQQTVEAAAKRFEIPEEKAVWLLSEIGIIIREEELMPLDTGEDETQRPPVQANLADHRHPVTLADFSNALQAYLKGRDWQSFDALLRYPLPGPPDVALSNILLQSDLLRGRLQEALHRVGQMRFSSTTISTPSIHLLIKTLLRRRRRRYNPDTMPWYLSEDIFLVIGLLFSLLRSEATKVEPYLWQEIFKRLGMMRRLTDIETLAIGLVEWYHPDRAATTRRRFVATSMSIPPLTTGAKPKTAAEVVPALAPVHSTAIADSSRNNPLRKIFHKQFFQGVVEWGFLTIRPYSHKEMPLIPRPPRPALRRLPKVYKEWAGCVPLFTWGVALARRLCDLGVYVEPRVIERGVRVRLAPVFLKSRVLPIREPINRMSSSMLAYLTLEQIVDAVEKAWGKELWRRVGWRSPVNTAKRWCECGKVKFTVEDGESQRIQRAKRDKAMRDEVLGTGIPEVSMLRRRRRIMAKNEMRVRWGRLKGGKVKFTVRDGQSQRLQRAKRDKAMRDEVLRAGAPGVDMLGRKRRIKEKNGIKVRRVGAKGGGVRFTVEDGESQRPQRAEGDKAARDEVLGMGTPKVNMLGRKSNMATNEMKVRRVRAGWGGARGR